MATSSRSGMTLAGRDSDQSKINSGTDGIEDVFPCGLRHEIANGRAVFYEKQLLIHTELLGNAILGEKIAHDMAIRLKRVSNDEIQGTGTDGNVVSVYEREEEGWNIAISAWKFATDALHEALIAWQKAARHWFEAGTMPNKQDRKNAKQKAESEEENPLATELKAELALSVAILADAKTKIDWTREMISGLNIGGKTEKTQRALAAKPHEPELKATLKAGL